MISTGSLAAFSAGAASALPSVRAAGLSGVLPVREQVTPQPQAKPGVSLKPGDLPGPNPRLPRGSLLNLQV